MTLTTDRLETIASWRDKYGTGHNVMLPAEEAEAMARELLANRETQPVAWQYRYSSLGLVGEWKTVQDELLCNTRPEYERRPIFTAPPAVPDYKFNSPVIPNGWKLVPSEPTEEMVAAAMNCDDVEFNSDETFCVNFDNIYEAMLAAAPENTPSHGLHQEQPSP